MSVKSVRVCIEVNCIGAGYISLGYGQDKCDSCIKKIIKKIAADEAKKSTDKIIAIIEKGTCAKCGVMNETTKYLNRNGDICCSPQCAKKL